MSQAHTSRRKRRWRRRWKDRSAAVSLFLRRGFDRFILSQKRWQDWKRRWRQRSERLTRSTDNIGFRIFRLPRWSHRWRQRGNQIEKSIEGVGYKLLPHKPGAENDTWWSRFEKRIDAVLDIFYRPALRKQHQLLLAQGWKAALAPFQQFNNRALRWFDVYVVCGLTKTGASKRTLNGKAYALLAALLACACLIAFVGIPAWTRHNERKWASQARLLLVRGYPTMAYQKAVRVLRRNENDETAARVVADLLERQGQPSALIWRRKVVTANNHPSNQLALAASALLIEPAPCPTAARVLADIASEAGQSVPYLRLSAQYNVKCNHLDAAEEQFLAALALAPANDEIALELAILRLQARDSAKLASARQSLETLSTHTNIGIRALRPLVKLLSTHGDLATALDYSDRLLKDDSSTFADHITHLNILTRKQDPAVDPFLSKLQKQVVANPAFVAQLSGWIIANHGAQQALDWLKTLPPGLRNAGLVSMATADAYAAKEDWQGLEQFLTPQSWGPTEYVRQAMLARAYRGLGQTRTADENFHHATELAAGMAVRLTNLARLVAAWGWDREVDQLLWDIFERFPDQGWAADSLQRQYYEHGNTKGLCRVFELLLQRSPQDHVLKNNLALFQLLLNTNLPAACRLALEAHESNPNSVVTASTYAFSLCVQGRANEGLKIMDSLGPEALKVPSVAAYYAILAAAAGDAPTAQEYARLARQAQLLPEEKTLLEHAQKGM